jgi:hypothetical protein
MVAFLSLFLLYPIELRDLVVSCRVLDFGILRHDAVSLIPRGPASPC